MKLRLVLFVLACAVFSFSNAQREQQLRKHVSFLASKELKGRSAQSEGSKKAFEYIKSDLEKAGLSCKDFYLPADSLRDGESEAMYEGNYHALYTVIESGRADKSDEYVVVTAEYTGYGTDTIQGYEIINYSAHHTASAVAIAMELAKKLDKERANLKRGIIFLFPEDGYTRPFAKYLTKDYKKIVAGFDLYNLGYQEKDSLGSYSEDEYNIYYKISPRFNNASSIITPLVLNNTEINSFVGKDYSNENSNIPFIFVSNEYFVSKHEDSADTLDYEMMAKLSEQIQEVVAGIANADLDIEEYQEEVVDEEEHDYLLGEKLSRRHKHNSYFGISLMPLGSNRHYYESGNMTGKDAYAFAAGLFYRWQFSKSWAIKLDANYEHINAKRHDGKYHADVVSVPLSLMLTTGGRSALEFDVYAGAYYDYILSGKIAGKKLDFDDFKRDEWGFQWGFDFRFSHFIIGAYYKTPWNSVNTEQYRKNSGVGRINESTTHLKIGWRF